MKGVGHGRGRVTRQNPAQPEGNESDGEERRMELEPSRKGAAAAFQEPPDNYQMNEGSEPVDEGSVVRPKLVTVSTPRSQFTDVNFIKELRDFMHHAKQTDEMLFEEIRPNAAKTRTRVDARGTVKSALPSSNTCSCPHSNQHLHIYACSQST